MSKNKESVIIVILFFVIAFLIYGLSLTNDFVHFDDNILIFDNPAVHQLTPATIAWVFTHFDPELYIPLTFLSFQIDHLIGGLNPFIFHLTNLILHTLNALLVYVFLNLLTKRKLLAIICGLIFLVHPLNAEAVAWASGRKDVLSAFFFLGSLIFYLKTSNERRATSNYYASIISFVLALLSKASVILLPLILILIDYKNDRRVDRKSILKKIPYFALSGIFGIVAIFGKQSVLADSPLKDSILMASKSTVFYLQKFLMPFDLSVIYPYNENISITSSEFFVPLIVLLVLIALIAIKFRNNRKATFGSLFFFLMLAPSFSNYAKAGDVFFASDRYVYLPIIGLIYIFVLILFSLIKSINNKIRIPIFVIPSIILIFFGVLAFKQSLVWKNTDTLFTNVTKHFDYSDMAFNKVGAQRFEQGKLAEAEEHLMKSLEIKPNARAYYNLGLVRLEQDDIEGVVEMNLKAIELDPKHVSAYLNLGYAYWKKGMQSDAEITFKKALSIKPDDVDVLTNLAGLYISMERPSEARELLERAIKIDPEDEYVGGLMERI
ncbi:tetratricopeptide repeat protein [Patescibacteria group bacterium]|nr:tetratricopeptide repeat protein [Patescibacteria group bacterium]MBU1123429.1 tetratricopeptide repeat protein [Patescibacteria group bacterium]MBU1911771.1 tetratricopeptide repeat protein [Patescibacteria group bacterium]